MLKDTIREFLQFLKLNRNASPHTVRAYDTDLTQFLEHAAGILGVKPSQVPVRALDADALRSFLDELHARGNSRASAARRLAALHARDHIGTHTEHWRSSAHAQPGFGAPGTDDFSRGLFGHTPLTWTPGARNVKQNQHCENRHALC